MGGYLLAFGAVEGVPLGFLRKLYQAVGLEKVAVAVGDFGGDGLFVATGLLEFGEDGREFGRVGGEVGDALVFWLFAGAECDNGRTDAIIGVAAYAFVGWDCVGSGGVKALFA